MEVFLKKSNILWSFLASVKLTLFLLLTLAATSIFGTLIPQQDNAAAAIRHYGETLYRILEFFDLFDLYHSWWFQVLLLLLAANLVVCSIERLSSTWKIFFAREPGLKPERFQKQPDKQEFTLQRPAEDVADSFRRALGKHFRTVREERHDQELYFFVEQYRWSRLGVYVVHLSVLLMLIGGLMGSLFGFQGFATIVEGESTSQVKLRGSDRSLTLDFSIKCEDFEVSFYDSGAPKEFRSDLVLLQDGRAVLEKSIVVNDPLRYQGISIYQASYGRLPPQDSQGTPESVTLRIEHKATGKSQIVTTEMNRPEKLEAGPGTLTLVDFQPDFQMRGVDLGPCLLARYEQEGQEPKHILLPLNYEHFDKMRQGALIISVQKARGGDNGSPAEAVYYTGLQIKKDPGVWVVYSGFMLMIIGCLVAFFLSHQRFCAAVTPRGRTSRIMVSGLANKNPLGMQRKVEKLADMLADAGKGTS